MSDAAKVPAPIIRLKCGVNNYAWGKKGSDSTAAILAASSEGDDYTIDENKPYAELWMGTHPSLPSTDFKTGRTLLDIINEDENAAHMLSPEIVATYGKKLPFLFKVLSVHQALSIQAHPNKKLAEVLHARDPTKYPDDNHKPEMAIALTEFDGLCGFRPLAEIRHFLKTVPPFRTLIGEEAATEFEKSVQGGTAADADSNKQALKNAFGTMMTSTQEQIKKATAELIQSIESKSIDLSNPECDVTITNQEMGGLVLRLNKQYPDDIGLFNLFFLNYIKMQPGEAMFLCADDIHAYLSGDIIECMASSDNVVRAGFTPKFKDVPTLTSMLTYNYAPISEQKMEPTDWPYATLNAPAYSSGSSVKLYNPPIPEFSVIRTCIASTLTEARAMATVRLSPIKGPSVLICTSGGGAIAATWKSPHTGEVETVNFPFGIGYVFFVAAEAEIIIAKDKQAGGEDLVVYQAICVQELSGGEGVEACLL